MVGVKVGVKLRVVVKAGVKVRVDRDEGGGGGELEHSLTKSLRCHIPAGSHSSWIPSPLDPIPAGSHPRWIPSPLQAEPLREVEVWCKLSWGRLCVGCVPVPYDGEPLLGYQGLSKVVQ